MKSIREKLQQLSDEGVDIDRIDGDMTLSELIWMPVTFFLERWPLLALCLLFLALPMSAATTPIVGTYYRANGTGVNCDVTVSWQEFTSTSNRHVQAGSIKIRITNGALSVSLEPTVGATPSGLSYLIQYSNCGSTVPYQKSWVVPVSGSAVNVVNIEFPPQGLVGESAIISLSQIEQGSAVDGDCVIWSQSMGMFIPGSCGGGSGGAAPYVTTVSSISGTYSILAATHGKGQYAQVTCLDNSSPKNLVLCAYNEDGSGNLVLNFSPGPFSGQVQVRQ